MKRHEVAFIVVGGVGAVLHGAPINTFDLDLVHSRVRENVDRLMLSLASLEAHYRAQPERKLGVSHLSSPGHQLLMTRYGPLDLLGAVGNGQGYVDLLPRSVEMRVGRGLAVRVLDLRTLIELKEALGGEKDAAVLPVLRRTLEEQSRR